MLTSPRGQTKHAMTNETEHLKDAREQLNLVLSFFPRVEAKLSTVLAVDTAMVATLAASVPPAHSISPWSAGTAMIAMTLLASSFLFLYLGAFPNLRGGYSSVIFFRDIAARNEGQYLQDYQSKTPESLKSDVLSQAWRNAEILTVKYRRLKAAFVTMACAIVPWGIALALFALERSNPNITVIRP